MRRTGEASPQDGQRPGIALEGRVKKMGKARRKARKRRQVKPRMTEDGRILVMTGLEATRARMPKYNGFAIRGGVHGDTEYNRRKEKRDLRRQLDEEL